MPVGGQDTCPNLFKHLSKCTQSFLVNHRNWDSFIEHMTNHLGSIKIINCLLHPRFSSWRIFSSPQVIINIFLFWHSTLVIRTELNLQQLFGNFINDFCMKKKIITDIILLIISLLILGGKEKYWENIGLWRKVKYNCGSLMNIGSGGLMKLKGKSGRKAEARGLNVQSHPYSSRQLVVEPAYLRLPGCWFRLFIDLIRNREVLDWG